jgi:hypothetical protein
MVAINDAFLIESAIYKILKMRFSDKPYYVALLELMHEVRPPLVFPRRSFPQRLQHASILICVRFVQSSVELFLSLTVRWSHVSVLGFYPVCAQTSVFQNK